MCRFLRTMFTGQDNQSYDIARVLWGVSTLAMIFFEGWAIARGQTFEAGTFSVALTGIAIGHGASLKLKGDTEPEVK